MAITRSYEEQAAAFVEQERVGDRVAALHPRRAQAVQQQVQLADRERAEIAFLPVQDQVADIAAVLLDVLAPRRSASPAEPAVGSQMRIPSVGSNSSTISWTTDRGV